MFLNTPLSHKLSIHYYNTDVCKDPSDHRSMPPELFCKKGVLRTFAKFTEKHQCQGLFFNKVAGLRPATLLKRESGSGGFRFTFFNKTPVVAASVTSSKWTDK